MSAPIATTLWARCLIDELARAGLREVVVAPGSRSTPLVMACAADPRLSVRVHLDERSAAFFALGVGKVSGTPAAIVTTSGTAVANCLPAVVEASQSGVPLLVLSADRPPRLRGADANQAIEQRDIFSSYPRSAFELGLPSTDGASLRHLRAVAARAYADTVGPDPGPVHLDVPFDKPLEPVELPSDLAEAYGPGAVGRPDGAPWVRIVPAHPRLDDAALGALASRLASARGAIVAGPSEQAPTLGDAVRRLGAATGFPVLADPLGGARYGPAGGACLVCGYDLFLRDAEVRRALRPSVVVRVGVSPTSAALQEWLVDHADVEHVVVDPAGRWKDHGATATTYVRADPVDTLDRLTVALSGRAPGAAATVGATPSVDSAWVERWRAVEAAALTALAELGGSVHEGVALAEALEAMPDDGCLVVSSSMPIRDLDAFGHPRVAPLRVVSNRGASGIDGVVSTAFGASSQHSGPTACVIGDIAFFHDSNGLLWSREPDAAVVFVVIDNDGGGIFHMLPIAEHEPDFTRFFATPHGIDPAHAAAAHGVDYAEVSLGSLRAELGSRLAAGRSAVLRLRSDRTANHRAHVEAREAVARSVRRVLG